MILLAFIPSELTSSRNVHITELNPQYIWGGDAITLAGTDLVWIDHVKTSLIGRQHLVTGGSASNRVSVTNNEFDGSTSWSATCDNHHYCKPISPRHPLTAPYFHPLLPT